MTNSRDFDYRQARRDLQLASIVDLQGSIHANDSKSSAGLIVHGLLFAGVLSVVANLGELYEQAAVTARWVGGALLTIGAAAFMRSVLALISAAQPHNPEQTLEHTRNQHVEAFFPPAAPRRDPPGGDWPLDTQLGRVRSLNSQRQFEREYAAEQIKLADIRATQAHHAGLGFRWLRLELRAVGAFLAVVALVAIKFPGLAVDRGPRAISVQWRLVQAGRESYVANGAPLKLTAGRATRLRLLARGTDLSGVQLSGVLLARCDQNRPPLVVPLRADQDVNGESEQTYVEQAVARPSCPGGRPAAVQVLAFGSGQGAGGVTRSSITLGTLS